MAQLVSTRNPLHSTRPLTVGVIPDAATLAIWASFSPEQREATCDVIELRLDTLKTPTAELRQALTGNVNPILLTARHPAEGGQGSEDAAGRMALIEPMLDLAALVDIELRSAMEMKPIVEKAHARSVQVIGSFHDFQATPSDEILRGAISFAQPAGLDGVKIATFLNSSADLTRLIQITSEPHRLRLSAMGMGPLGRVSRLVLAKCGSLLNYGYIGESNAPGQWPAARLKELLSEL
jgi:3-dehydroquinate dehydratase-1